MIWSLKYYPHKRKRLTLPYNRANNIIIKKTRSNLEHHTLYLILVTENGATINISLTGRNYEQFR
jgi:hypothetical protein